MQNMQDSQSNTRGTRVEDETQPDLCILMLQAFTPGDPGRDQPESTLT